MDEQVSRGDKKIDGNIDARVIEDAINDSFFFPNYDYFCYIDEKTIKQRVISRIKALLFEAEKQSGTQREEILRSSARFFCNVKKANIGIVLFGGAVYRRDREFTSDLDIHVIANNNHPASRKKLQSLAYGRKPRSFNVQYSCVGSRFYHDAILGFKRFGLFNHILVLPNHPVPTWLYDAINKEREILKKAPFCDGGVGELIVYPAIKILEGKERQFFGTDDEAELVFSKKIPIIGGYDLMGFPATPEERHRDAKRIFREHFNENELYRLALAALNRIAAKKERKDALAKRFVREIKSSKIKSW